MEPDDAAWQRFLEATETADAMGGVAGAEFAGLGPFVAGAAGPRDITIGSFVFFPAAAREDVDLPKDAFLLAQSETRAILVGAEGKLHEVHYGGRRRLPFRLAEVMALASPFVAAPIERVGGTRFLSPAAEATMRDAMGPDFDAAADLFGVPLLAGARAELESRIGGSRVLLGVAAFLLAGVFLVAWATHDVALALAVILILGCIPVTLIVLGVRNGSKARRELERLPRP